MESQALYWITTQKNIFQNYWKWIVNEQSKNGNQSLLNVSFIIHCAVQRFKIYCIVACSCGLFRPFPYKCTLYISILCIPNRHNICVILPVKTKQKYDMDLNLSMLVTRYSAYSVHIKQQSNNMLFKLCIKKCVNNVIILLIWYNCEHMK